MGLEGEREEEKKVTSAHCLCQDQQSCRNHCIKEKAFFTRAQRLLSAFLLVFKRLWLRSLFKWKIFRPIRLFSYKRN